MTESESLSIDEIAELSGCAVETIRSYAEAGIFDLASLSAADVTGLRLISSLVASGIPLRTISDLFRNREITPGFLRNLTSFPVTLKRQSYKEAIEDLGLDPNYVERIFAATGIPSVDFNSSIRADDLELIRILSGVERSAIPEETVRRVLRMFGYSLRKNAEVMRDLFRDEVEAPERAKDQSFDRFLESTAAQRLPLQRVGLAIIGILQRRLLEELVFENVTIRFQEYLHATGRLEKESQDQAAVAFADLVDFTPLTLEKGDREAFRYASKFEALSQEVLRPAGVRVIKSLGDGLLLHSQSIPAAVEGCLELIHSTRAAGLPGVRVGLAAGPVVCRDGDVFGATVNLAARLADKARSSEILTHSSVVNGASSRKVNWNSIGRTVLKGLAPIEVYSSMPPGE